MKKWLKFIVSKLKYDSLLQTIINAFKLVGVSLYPYYVYEENSNSNGPAKQIATPLKKIEIKLAEKNDMVQFLDFPDMMGNLERLHERLDRGDICVAAWLEGKIIAFSWANLISFEFLTEKYELNEDEAYLYNAYTAPTYRGKRLAYILRHELYKILTLEGKRKLYSFSIKTNTAAIKFKKNIGARIIGSGLKIKLFGRWYSYNKTAFEKSRVLVQT